ncbi:MAG: phycobilisome protein [Leptolyngbyaceae cyanobacterium CSU_1_4]|nr:phycobilisome protein [Leptolyngbyaceae cyanobacterium CSU_1_4]
MTNPQLSETVKELIQKARIVSFATWQDRYPTAVIQRFQTADDESRYLTDEDLQDIAARSPDTAVIAGVRMVRDRAKEIVDEARAGVLSAFPTLTEPGGGLYPPLRAEACWRDFWHFLRCITYGMAGQRTDYTSVEGLHYMQLLYEELEVPLEAMVLGVEELKTASLKQIQPEERARFAPYFDHLTEQLKQFAVKKV